MRISLTCNTHSEAGCQQFQHQANMVCRASKTSQCKIEMHAAIVDAVWLRPDIALTDPAQLTYPFQLSQVLFAASV